MKILKVNFLEEGGNVIRYENKVYMLFVRYVREVVSGWCLCGSRKFELCYILEFVIGVFEEVGLGFEINLLLEFDILIILRV